MNMTAFYFHVVANIFLLILIGYADSECPSDYNCESNQRRIIGGENASGSFYPWMAFLFHNIKPICSGSLITRFHVLTAGHCVENATSWNGWHVFLGSENWCEPQPGQMFIPIEAVFLHEEYNTIDNITYNDIAVLQLSTRVDLLAICLPCEDLLLGSPAILAGWGVYDYTFYQPSCILKFTFMNTFEHEECAETKLICALGDRTTCCEGDSGGPLFTINEDNQPVLNGIISVGPPNCSIDAGFVGSVNVYYYVPWIIDKITRIPPL